MSGTVKFMDCRRAGSRCWVWALLRQPRPNGQWWTCGRSRSCGSRSDHDAQQLSTARSQLTQAQQTFQSLTGSRGMEQLLAGTVRNYLPADWARAGRRRSGRASAAYQALAADVQAAINGNAVLTATAAGVAVACRARAARGRSPIRRDAAGDGAPGARAPPATGSRRSSNSIDAIPRAQDPKAILDLQARIAAEQGMLANEQTKLQVLYQAAQAEEWARVQRAREQGIADIGSLRGLPAMGL